MNGLKEVYFLGAGASADAGAPLSWSFLDDDYLDNKLDIKNALMPEYYKRFQKIRRIAKQIFPYTKDIESLLNSNSSALFLGLIQEGKLENLWDIRTPLDKEIEWYILQTIFSSLKEGKINNEAILSYYNFFKRLGNNDSIITLNYDLIADHSLLESKREFNYSIEPAKILFPVDEFKVTSGISLYKLHGSMNWLICPNEDCKRISVYFEKMAQYAEDPNNQRGVKCKFCNHDLQRIIVPPRWDKEKSYSGILNDIWRKASAKLREADVVNVIGYSLPESDIYARYLLASALNDNQQLEIHVINSNPEIQKKYQKFLKDSNVDLKRYLKLPYKFKEYIDLEPK